MRTSTPTALFAHECQSDQALETQVVFDPEPIGKDFSDIDQGTDA